MKKKLSVTLVTSFLIIASSSVMAKSVVTENPFSISNTAPSNLVMSSDHDHDHDKKKEGKCGEGKSTEKNQDKKTKGKCGEDHMKKNKGKCAGH